MALVWTLRDPNMTSTIISVSKIEQLYENLEALKNIDFTEDELKEIDLILADN